MKSLKVLDQKLVLLSEYAEFGVNANAVIGTGVPEPEGALTVASRARELGFNASLGILHDGKGRMKPLNERERLVYNEIKKTGVGALLWSIRSKKTSPEASRITGSVVQAPATSTSMNSVWCTGAPNRRVIPPCPSTATPIGHAARISL